MTVDGRDGRHRRLVLNGRLHHAIIGFDERPSGRLTSAPPGHDLVPLVRAGAIFIDGHLRERSPTDQPRPRGRRRLTMTQSTTFANNSHYSLAEQHLVRRAGAINRKTPYRSVPDRRPAEFSSERAHLVVRPKAAGSPLTSPSPNPDRTDAVALPAQAAPAASLLPFNKRVLLANRDQGRQTPSAGRVFELRLCTGE